MDNNFISGSGGSTPNPFLQTGAKELDQLLCFSSVPPGGAIHLDFEPGVGPATLLLGMCKTALSRNERLAFIYAPTFSHMTEGDVEGTAALRSGRGLAIEFDMGLDDFSLAPDFNRCATSSPIPSRSSSRPSRTCSPTRREPPIRCSSTVSTNFSNIYHYSPGWRKKS